MVDILFGKSCGRVVLKQGMVILDKDFYKWSHSGTWSLDRMKLKSLFDQISDCLVMSSRGLLCVST